MKCKRCGVRRRVPDYLYCEECCDEIIRQMHLSGYFDELDDEMPYPELDDPYERLQIDAYLDGMSRDDDDV